MAVAHPGVEPGDVHVLEVLRDRRQGVVGHEPLQGQVLLAHGLGQQVLAAVDRLFAAFLAEPLPDLVAGPGALDEVLPVLAGPGALRLGGEDLHPVAVVQFAVERDELSVDPCSDGAVAHLGVDRVGEVHRGRSGGQGHDLALGGEDKHFAGIDLEAQRVQELARIRRFLLPVHQ